MKLFKKFVLAGGVVLTLVGGSTVANSFARPDSDRFGRWVSNAVSEKMLAIAWGATRNGKQIARPLPWLDSGLAVRLYVPRLDRESIVLSGQASNVYEYGLVWHERSVFPGAPGISVISGIAGTHFSFLRDLREDDRFQIELRNGQKLTYAVERIALTEEGELKVDKSESESVLLLSTSYALGSGPGGSVLHYVVIARPAPEQETV